MRKALIRGTVAAAALAGPTMAEVPSVVTDIPPVHSLAAMVMQGLGSPQLLVPPGASPHGYAMRPSEARALDRAEVVFWTGPALTPWLENSLEALAADAEVMALMAVPGTVLHAFREGAAFGGHEGHGHGAEEEGQGIAQGEGPDPAGHEDHEDHDGHADHAGHEDHTGHQDHAGEDHAPMEHDEQGAHDPDHAGHEDHAEEDHDHAGQAAPGAAGHDHAAQGAQGGAVHDHTGSDPHVWLDPENARLWLSAMAETLARHDPENAARYRENAESARADLAALIAALEEDLAPLRDRPFVVFHDAYHYFEDRFDLAAAGAISLSDASAPSPARIAEIQGRVAEMGVHCVFSEPQFDPRLVETVLRGTQAETGVIDPLGTALEPGVTLYPTLIREMGAALRDCLK